MDAVYAPAFTSDEQYAKAFGAVEQVAELQRQLDALREQVNAKYWEGIAADNAKLREQLAKAESGRACWKDAAERHHSDSQGLMKQRESLEIQIENAKALVVKLGTQFAAAESRVTTLEAKNKRQREASEALLKHCSTEIEGGSMRDLSDKAVRLDWLSRLLVLRNSLRAALAPSSSSPTKPTEESPTVAEVQGAPAQVSEAKARYVESDWQGNPPPANEKPDDIINVWRVTPLHTSRFDFVLLRSWQRMIEYIGHYADQYFEGFEEPKMLADGASIKAKLIRMTKGDYEDCINNES